MKKNNKIILGTIVGLVILISLSLFLMNLNNPTGASVYLEEIDLAINPIANSALVFIAEERGYFEEQGLKIKYHNFPTGKLALDALIGGGADIATTADVPIALAGLANQEISTIATIEYSTDNIQVVARKDAGIMTPKDLKGKKIATTKGGGPLFFTYKFLERYDLDVSDVKLVHLKPSYMVISLIKGDIDAFIVFEPSPAITIKELGEDKVTIFAPDDLYGETWNIVVMQDFDKDITNKFLKALLKAELFLKKYPKTSLSIVSKYSETEKDVLIDIMKKQNYGVVLNNVLTDYLDEEAKWAIDQGLSSNKDIPDYNNFIDTNYLTELKPTAVTI